MDTAPDPHAPPLARTSSGTLLATKERVLSVDGDELPTVAAELVPTRPIRGSRAQTFLDPHLEPAAIPSLLYLTISGCDSSGAPVASPGLSERSTKRGRSGGIHLRSTVFKSDARHESSTCFGTARDKPLVAVRGCDMNRPPRPYLTCGKPSQGARCPATYAAPKLRGVGETLSQIAPENESEVENEQGDSEVVGDGCPSGGREQLVCGPEQEGGAEENPFEQVEWFWLPGGVEGEAGERDSDEWQGGHDLAGFALAEPPGRIERKQGGAAGQCERQQQNGHRSHGPSIRRGGVRRLRPWRNKRYRRSSLKSPGWATRRESKFPHPGDTTSLGALGLRGSQDSLSRRCDRLAAAR